MDLVSFIAGEVFSSIPLILAMLRNLPEGSRYYAAIAVDREDDEENKELDPRTEALLDHRVWTLDRRLKAMAINAINLNTAVSGHWGEDGPPDMETIGPASWRKTDKKKPAEQEFKDNFDFFRKMGFPLG